MPELYKYKLLEFLEMNLSLDTLLKVKKNFGMPTYIYNESQLKSSFQELRNALPECIDIFMLSKLILTYQLSN